MQKQQRSKRTAHRLHEIRQQHRSDSLFFKGFLLTLNRRGEPEEHIKELAAWLL